MKLIERYSYNGCKAADGPWEDVIEENVSASELLARIRGWCEDIQHRVAQMDPPRDPEEWRFTSKPEYIQAPGGAFDIATQTSDNRWYVTDYYGQGETYRLICEKEEKDA